MSNSPNSERSRTRPHDDAEQQRRRRNWSGIAEERIQEAQRNGEFTNLRGEGRPLRSRQRVYAGDHALAYDLLASNAMAPPEIERGKAIDAELRRADELLETLRHRRVALGIGTARTDAGARRMYQMLRDRTEASYAVALRAINSQILSLNILAPAALHRRLINVDARLREFAEEFPGVGD